MAYISFSVLVARLLHLKVIDKLDIYFVLQLDNGILVLHRLIACTKKDKTTTNMTYFIKKSKKKSLSIRGLNTYSFDSLC